MQIAPKWADVVWCANAHLPVILKEYYITADAQKALDHGVSGIIVSNHGGALSRCDYSTLNCINKNCAIVPPDYPVLLDGGIRRGRCL